MYLYRYQSLQICWTNQFSYAKKNPNRLIISFVAQLEILAAKNKVDVKSKFLEVEAEIKTRLNDVSSRLQIIFETQSNISSETEDSNASKNFLRYQKKQLFNLQRHFNNYDDTLPVFGFNSGMYDLNLIKNYLIPHLLNDKAVTPTVIKKANQFISFKFGDSFFGKLKNLNPLKKDFAQFEQLIKSGKDESVVLREMVLKENPTTGIENYALLEELWKVEKMKTFRDFLCWYNNKDVFTNFASNEENDEILPRSEK